MDHCNKVNTQVVDELILPADSLKNLIDSRIKKYGHKCKGGKDGKDGNDGENGAAAVFSVVGEISVSETAANGNGVLMKNKRLKRKNRSGLRVRQNLDNEVTDYSVNYDYTNNGFTNGTWTVGKTSDYLIEVTANYSISAEEVELSVDSDTTNPVASIYLKVNGTSENGALAEVGHVAIPGSEGLFNSPVLNGTLTFTLGLSLTQGDLLNLNVDTYFSNYYDIAEGQEVTIDFETINWTVTELAPPENNILLSRLNKLRL